ncbi:MAG: bifunctional biotin--[acetyl-CoA-carboxylase] ligase/biotin operon repressor BirA [Moritella sp.]|uniref:bifunctional biotin--[acetyl-CoA-carboxylase] ligase/biotin operon repressor BirA n=1 Tax=Moritella sp. TaxID=78556 RepID=UPI0029B42C23|nr:bifunctional biotin--[acetyl-CoA-carboxylase] ligase/biotin operon repressor BirA [Moritella sp.]MDX2320551.1 bifunctional biotin--[acetyl-CoA-carboxylase] ligase/biotin operon repressor BirA [Moritella sp.]
MTASRQQLIRLLADGEFHSGEVLGETLGVSRMAVSKQVKVLETIGLDVFKVTGKGYKLSSPLQLLDAELIANGSGITVESHQVLGSTNQHLLDKAALLHKGHSCFAEYQTAGRGRRGNKWVSPYGSHLYTSTYWSLDAGIQAASGLSLVIGIAVARTLTDLGIPNTQLKWPNDVYVDGKKIAGVLVEIIATAGGECHLVIGLGLNVNMPLQAGLEIDQAWTDISQQLQPPIDRNQLATRYLSHLVKILTDFEQLGFCHFVEEWNECDAFKDCPVVLTLGVKQKHGIAKGIDHTGALLLEVDGVISPHVGGEVSLRRAEM